jgi:monothiol glutaredoxin
MPRPILSETNIHPAIRATIASHQQQIVNEVMASVSANPIVVVGMAFNPFSKKACKALDALKQPYQYLEYGSYLSQWRQRNALKLWTGWPTLPMVFVKGSLIGGFNDLQTLSSSGELKKLLG